MTGSPVVVSMIVVDPVLPLVVPPVVPEVLTSPVAEALAVTVRPLALAVVVPPELVVPPASEAEDSELPPSPIKSGTPVGHPSKDERPRARTMTGLVRMVFDEGRRPHRNRAWSSDSRLPRARADSVSTDQVPCVE